MTPGNLALTSTFRWKEFRELEFHSPQCISVCVFEWACGSIAPLWSPYLLSLRFQYKHITNSHMPLPTPPVLQTSIAPHLIQSQHGYKEAARQGVPVSVCGRFCAILQLYSSGRMQIFGTCCKMVRISLNLKASLHIRTSVAFLHLSVLGYFKHRNPKPSNRWMGLLINAVFFFSGPQHAWL